MNEILEIIAAVGLPVLGAVLFFVSRRNGGTSEFIEKQADRNHNDLRSNLESDRERELAEDIDIKRERNRLEQERRASKRTGSLISNARKSISGIIKDSKGIRKD
jgi:hypothetical protein